MEERIRQLAIERGHDPNFVAKVIKGESAWNPAARLTTKKEDSGGLFQLNTKNGLGVEALKRGINPHDPTQWEQQAIFALDEAKKSWRPWTVARQLQGERVPGAASAASPQGLPRQSFTPAAQPSEGPRPAADQYRESPLNRPGFLAAVDPFVKLANERKEQQTQQALATAQQALANQPQPAPSPAPVAPLPPVDYSTLLMPRLRRGLLADQSLGLLGAP